MDGGTEAVDCWGEPGSAADADGGCAEVWDQHGAALYVAPASDAFSGHHGEPGGAAVCAGGSDGAWWIAFCARWN